MQRTEYSSLRQGLVGAWCPSLGASGLTLIDRSGYGRHAAHSNPFTATGSRLSLLYQAAGPGPSTSYVNGIPGGTQARSIAAWLFVRSFAGNNGALTLHTSSGQIFCFRCNSNDAILFTDGVNGSNNITYPTLPPTNTWFHVGMSFENGQYGFFLNGVQIRSGTFIATINTGPIIAVRIGQRVDPGGFAGSLDDARVYNRALTHAEFAQLASRPGIGLTPLPDRAAGLPRRFSVNVGGDWRPADAYVNVGGVWRLGQPSVNVSGTWR